MATEMLHAQTLAEPRRSFLDALAALEPDARLGIYRSGGFTPAERTLWAANYPEEVPLVNDEFEWPTSASYEPTVGLITRRSQVRILPPL